MRCERSATLDWKWLLPSIGHRQLDLLLAVDRDHLLQLLLQLLVIFRRFAEEFLNVILLLLRLFTGGERGAIWGEAPRGGNLLRLLVLHRADSVYQTVGVAMAGSQCSPISLLVRSNQTI